MLLGIVILNEEPGWILAISIILIFIGAAVVTGQIRLPQRTQLTCINVNGVNSTQHGALHVKRL